MFGGKGGNSSSATSSGKSADPSVIKGGVLERPGAGHGAPSSSETDGQQTDTGIGTAARNKSSGTEAMQNSDTGREPRGKIISGVLSRDSNKVQTEQAENTRTGPRISTLFKPIENPEKEKPTFDAANNSKTGSNIHTISSGRSQTNPKAETKTSAFSGSGHSLGKRSGASDAPVTNKIVRRIPGFGIIESERPTKEPDGETEQGTRVFYMTRDPMVAPKLGISESGYISDVELPTDSGDSDAGSVKSLSLSETKAKADVKGPSKNLDESDTESCCSESLLNPDGSCDVQSAVEDDSSESCSALVNANKRLGSLTEASSGQPEDTTLNDSGRGASPVDTSSPELGTNPGEIRRADKKLGKSEKRLMMPYFSSDEDETGDILFKVKKSGNGVKSHTNKGAQREGKIVHGVMFYYPSTGSQKSVRYKKSRVFGAAERDRSENSSGSVVARKASWRSEFGATRNQRGLSLDVPEAVTHPLPKKRKLDPGRASPQATPITRNVETALAEKSRTGNSSQTPGSIFGLDMDMSQFSCHKKRTSTIDQAKKLETEAPKKSPSFNLDSLKRPLDSSASSCHPAGRKRFRRTLEYAEGPGSDQASTSKAVDGKASKPSVFQAPSTNAARTFEFPVESNDTVECPACQKKVERAFMSQHLGSCPVLNRGWSVSAEGTNSRNSAQDDFVGMTNCPACQQEIQASKVNDHLNVCPKLDRPVSTEAAMSNDHDMATDMDEHDPVVVCPSCPQRFRYSLLNDHLDSCLPDL